MTKSRDQELFEMIEYGIAHRNTIEENRKTKKFLSLLNMGMASLSNKLKSITGFQVQSLWLINLSVWEVVEGREEQFLNFYQVSVVKCYIKGREGLQTCCPPVTHLLIAC